MAMLLDSSFQVDKLSYEIFSILESNFLFGPSKSSSTHIGTPTPTSPPSKENKVRVLSMDASGPTSAILAAHSLAHLESFLCTKSGEPHSSVSDFFDVAAGSGTGGILASLLFTRGHNGRPLFTAAEALQFMIRNAHKFGQHSPSKSVFRRVFGSGEKKVEKLLKSTFGELSLKDTIKSVLVPCYDLSTRAPFVFSRADAVEVDSYDFKMCDVCIATWTAGGEVELRSVDKRTRILAIDGGIAMSNPTAAAVTHVLNNKQEFPLCNGVEDLLVLSFGDGDSGFGRLQNSDASPAHFARIARNGASDMVDQAVSMAFGHCRSTNYVRIQANGMLTPKRASGLEKRDILGITEEMLKQKNVESVLFKGKKIVERSNLDKLELFAGELIKEQEKRKTSILPVVALKQAPSSLSPPRSSSATTLSSLSSSS